MLVYVLANEVTMHNILAYDTIYPGSGVSQGINKNGKHVLQPANGSGTLIAIRKPNALAFTVSNIENCYITMITDEVSSGCNSLWIAEPFQQSDQLCMWPELCYQVYTFVHAYLVGNSPVHHFLIYNQGPDTGRQFFTSS